MRREVAWGRCRVPASNAFRPWPLFPAKARQMAGEAPNR